VMSADGFGGASAELPDGFTPDVLGMALANIISEALETDPSSELCDLTLTVRFVEHG
jgi:hypothetical protein